MCTRTALAMVPERNVFQSHLEGLDLEWLITKLPWVFPLRLGTPVVMCMDSSCRVKNDASTENGELESPRGMNGQPGALGPDRPFSATPLPWTPPRGGVGLP